ncbi:SurA N-terminal domain-containing protein [Candidatus Bipolaricaulota bacterium]|nr:SurA N-terminal domain-containing protein [Candidatus Bipolaricaulota bacterium]MBS3793187.1 SurA N-terminal domain-containing protein [Candidatus Bipolaricaulota bacterium]
MKFAASEKAVAALVGSLLVVSLFVYSNPVHGEKVVAEVNGEEITREELSKRARIDNLFVTLQGAPLFARFLMETDEGQATLDSYKEYVLERLIEEKLIVQKANEVGIEASESEIETRLRNIIQETENVTSKEELIDRLEQDRRDIADLKQEISIRIVREKLRERVLAKVEVSSEEIKQYYEKNKETFRDVDGEIQPLREVKKVIRERIRTTKKEKAWKNWLAKLKEEATIDRNMKS